MPRLNRFLGLTAILAATLPAAAEAGQFDGVTVRVATFGGLWLDVVKENVGTAFEAEGGKIEWVLGQPATNFAKLIASRGQEPPFDVLETVDNLLPGLVAGKYIEKIDLAKVPNTKEIDLSLFDDTKVPIYFTEEGILYNKAKLAEQGIPVPQAYTDLTDARLKGRISMPDISASGALPALVVMAHETGGSEANIDPGLDLIQKIEPQSFWTSSSILSTQLTNGDIWVGLGQAGNVQRLKKQIDLGFAYADAGNGKSGVMKMNFLIKTKGTKVSAAADWVINAFLSKKMQIAELDKAGEVPVTRSALETLSKDPQYAFLRLKPEDVAKLYRIDFTRVNEASYVQKWNRKIAH